MKLINKKIIKTPEFVYDLQIKDNHNFMANNLMVHNCKDPSRQGSKALLKIKDCPNKIALTGTPILNTPLDIYVILKWLDIIDEKIDFWIFKNTFANLDDWGNFQSPKNIQQLSNLLHTSMIRREKSKNLKGLPEKIYENEYIDLSPKQKTLYKIINKELFDEIHTMTHSEEPLSKLINLRKITGNPQIIDSSLTDKDNVKLERLKDLVEEIVSNNQKVVIYSNWTTITNLLKDTLKEYNPAYITGEVDDKKRIEETNRFQNDISCKVCIGTSAMGVGLTLTAASYLIFYDLPWTKAEYEQISDRIHRIGQNNTATIINLICKNTIDEGIYQCIEKKGRMAEFIVDGRIDTSKYRNLIQAFLSFGG